MVRIGVHGLKRDAYDQVPGPQTCRKTSRWKVIQLGEVQITVYPQHPGDDIYDAANASLPGIRVTLDVQDATPDQYAAVPIPELLGHEWKWWELGDLRLSIFRPLELRPEPAPEAGERGA